MAEELYTILLVFLSLLALSAFSSMAEVVYSSERKKLIASVRKDNRIYELLRKPEKFFAATLILNNIANILLASFITYKVSRISEELVIFSTIFITATVIVFGEILPKVWGIKNSHEIAKIILRLMYLPSQILSPLIKPIERLIESMGEEEMITHIPLEILEKEQIKMIEGVKRLAELELQDIMIPAEDVKTIDYNMTLKEAIEKIKQTRHTRYPLISDGKVLGIILSKNLLFMFPDKILDENMKISDIVKLYPEILKPAKYAPPNKSVIDQLRDFRRWKTHMVCIIDDQGKFEGIVTMEDIIEEIVGSIKDEFSDQKENFWVDGEFIYAKGQTPIRDINRELGVNIDERFSTISSTIISILGRIPEKGEKIIFDGWEIEVIDSTRSKINLVRLKHLPYANKESVNEVQNAEN
ncbi:MAG: hemolysin family protein [Candidatus Calescibacterium sp.]